MPKRWDAATTVDGLHEARRIIAATGAGRFEADELEPPLRALCEERGWKVGDLFMAIRVAVTGPHRDAAAVRHDRRAGSRSDTGASRRRAGLADAGLRS